MSKPLSLLVLLLLSGCASTDARMGVMQDPPSVGEFQCPENGSGLVVRNSEDMDIAHISETNGLAQIGFGDYNEQQNKTYLHVSDYARNVIAHTSNGKVILGDSSGWGNSTVLVVDDANGWVRVYGPILMQSDNKHWWRVEVSDTGVLTTTDLGRNP